MKKSYQSMTASSPRGTSPRHVGVRALTLLELLVVMSIVGVLLALLIPSVFTVKEMANRTRCAGLLRQMGMANIAYATDHKSQYVYGAWIDSTGYAKTRWFSVQDYLDCIEVKAKSNYFWTKNMLCPSARPPQGRELMAEESFGYNFASNNGIPWGKPETLYYWKSSQITTPSQSMMFSDAANWILFINATTPGNVQPRHRSKANSVFYDAHVEALSEAILDSYTATDRFWALK